MRSSQNAKKLRTKNLSANGRLLLSFDVSGTIGAPAVSFDDEDVLEYDPSGGTWEPAYDGSAHYPGWPAADLVALFAIPVLPTPSPTMTSAPTTTAAGTATHTAPATATAVSTGTPIETPSITNTPATAIATATATQTPPPTATLTGSPPASATRTDRAHLRGGLQRLR